MRKYFIFILVVSFLSVSYADENTRDYLLNNETDMKEINVHTCRRVKELGKGKVSDDDCIERLASVNKVCLDIVKSIVPEDPSIDEVRGMMRVVMMCPVANLLGLPFDAEKILSSRPKI